MTNFVSSIPLTIPTTPDPLGQPPKVIVSWWSTNGWTPIAVTQPPNDAIVNITTFTAATLKTILNLTGPGALKSFSIRSADATARTMRVKITLDGVVAFDSTSASIASANAGAIIVVNEVPFALTCLIEAATSNTETTPFNLSASYHTN